MFPAPACFDTMPYWAFCRLVADYTARLSHANAKDGQIIFLPHSFPPPSLLAQGRA
jgi:hypothetical protein